jgi:hypothetical protein
MPVRLQPAAGLPTPLSIAEDQAFSTLISTQLDSVRKTAENWRNGLVAMTGLIAAFSIIKGPSDVAGLTHGVAYWVGILLFLALRSAAFGAWSSLAAAYGEPVEITQEQFHQQGGIDGYRHSMALLAAAKKLKHAQNATIVTLVLLTHGVAYWVGILLFLALRSAAFGAWSSLAAAYGEPVEITQEQFHQQGGIDGYRHSVALLAAAKKLKHAQNATIVTLVLLTLAVALTWYGPRSASTLDLERRLLPNVCGKLVSSSNGYIDVKPSDSAAVRLARTDVVKLTLVETCP